MLSRLFPPLEDDTFPQANFGRGPGGSCTAGKPDSGTGRDKFAIRVSTGFSSGVVELEFMDRYYVYMFMFLYIF